MEHRELMVLEALNMTQCHVPRSPDRSFGLVTAQRVTDFINQRPDHMTTKAWKEIVWRPTLRQVVSVLNMLNGVGSSSARLLRRTDPLVETEKGRPTLYGLSRRGVKALMA